MMGRWHMLVGPDAAEHPASPRAAEALGGWMLGTLWALAGLWLGDLGLHSLVPGVLLGGLLALWGWRHLEWLFWLPTVVVVAMLLEPLSPLPWRGRFGAIVYVDILMVGVGAVALARAVAFRRWPLPRTPLDGLLLAMLLACGLALLGAPPRAGALAALKRCAVSVGIYYATASVAARPGGSRFVWPAFPLAAALVGLHALWATLQGPGRLLEQSRAADAPWQSVNGLFGVLLCAVPVTLGLALDAGHRGARRAWRLAALAGLVGLGLHLARAGALPRPQAWTGAADLSQVAAFVLAALALLVLARMAWRLGRERRQERPRWIALTLTLVLVPFLEPATDVLAGPTSQLLLATGGGLVMGAWRAERAAAAHTGEAVVLREAA